MHYSRQTFERFLTRDQERQLFSVIKNRSDITARRDYAMMRLLRHSGIRVCALVGLTVHDARQAIRAEKLHVRKQINKGKKAYNVRLAKKGIKALKDLLAIRKELQFADDLSAPLLMSRQQGKGLSIRSAQARIKYWREMSGLSVAVSAHWFRHTFAQRIVETSTARDPLSVAMVQLGHSDIKSTMIYTLPTHEEIDESMRLQG